MSQARVSCRGTRDDHERRFMVWTNSTRSASYERDTFRPDRPAQNTDEFTRTTGNAVENVGGAGKGKVINIINPADLPLIMLTRSTA